jgi:hypothetical protein
MLEMVARLVTRAAGSGLVPLVWVVTEAGFVLALVAPRARAMTLAA